MAGCPGLVSTSRDERVDDEARRSPIVEPEMNRLRRVSQQFPEDRHGPRLRRDILRVGHGAHDVDVRHRIGEAGCHRCIREQRRVTFTAGLIDPRGLAGDAVVVSAAGAENGCPRQVATVESEALSCTGQRVGHKPFRNARPHRGPVDGCPGILQPVQHVLVRDHHADRVEHLDRGRVDALYLLVVENRALHRGFPIRAGTESAPGLPTRENVRHRYRICRLWTGW